MFLVTIHEYYFLTQLMEITDHRREFKIEDMIWTEVTNLDRSRDFWTEVTILDRSHDLDRSRDFGPKSRFWTEVAI